MGESKLGIFLPINEQRRTKRIREKITLSLTYYSKKAFKSSYVEDETKIIKAREEFESVDTFLSRNSRHII